MTKQPGEIIADQMLESCRTGCTPAKLAIANSIELIAGDTLLDPETVGKKLGECMLGPELVGECGTQKIICRHPVAAHTHDTNEQVILLTEYVL